MLKKKTYVLLSGLIFLGIIASVTGIVLIKFTNISPKFILIPLVLTTILLGVIFLILLLKDVLQKK